MDGHTRSKMVILGQERPFAKCENNGEVEDFELGVGGGGWW